mgnify:CR=1 FL=1|tara:strand:+ start:2249 stop:2836 length:588 start_codon:yes stop_codon:yes gene_type:complete
MASNIFQTLELEAFRAGINPRTAESREWFRRKAQSIRRVNRSDLMREEPVQLNNKQILGSMQMFFYQPKHRETLPYYDSFPLVVVIGPADKGFLGLNLHYLPPILRAKLLDGLLDTTNNKSYNDSTRFQVTYGMLQRASKMKYFKPCIKHYLNDQVRSRFAAVPAPEWEIAAFLPTADFQKASKTKVYSDSRRMI